MSKKFLNKIISAILVLAICSTAFIGCVVSAEEPVATYKFHDGETIKNRDKDGSINITFTSDTPFNMVQFRVNDYINDDWVTPKLHENGWLQISNVEFVGATMANPEHEVVIPEEENILFDSFYDKELRDHTNSVIVIGDMQAEEDQTTEIKYYSSLTLKLTFDCAYTAEYQCTECGCIYDMETGLVYDVDGNEISTIETGIWYTDFEACPNPSCDVEITTTAFRKYKYSFATGWKYFTFELAEANMADNDYNMWAVSSNPNGDAINKEDVNYIHACTYRDMPHTEVDANHYEIQSTTCLVCGDANKQIYLDKEKYKFGGTEYESISYSTSLYPDYVSMTYNNDGTVNLNVLIEQDHFVNGRDAYQGDWEPLGLVITNAQGEIFTRYAGTTGQAKEDISTIKNEYEDSQDVDIDPETAKEMGCETDTGLRMFSYKNIPAADIGGEFLFSIVGNRNAYPDKVFYGKTFSYSAKDYCYELIERAESILETDEKYQEYQTLSDVSKALLNYGAATQQYFSEEAIAEEDLPNYNLAEEYKNTYTTVSLTNSDVAATKPTNENVFFRGVSAIFRTSPSIKFYFRIFDSENVTVDFKVGDGEVKNVAASDMQRSSTYYAYTISDIGVENMYIPVSFSLKVDGVEVQSGSCSLAGYAAAAVEAGSTELADAMKAMIYYCEAVKLLLQA